MLAPLCMQGILGHLAGIIGIKVRLFIWDILANETRGMKGRMERVLKKRPRAQAQGGRLHKRL